MAGSTDNGLAGSDPEQIFGMGPIQGDNTGKRLVPPDSASGLVDDGRGIFNDAGWTRTGRYTKSSGRYQKQQHEKGGLKPGLYRMVVVTANLEQYHGS
jgi:hypothetical protein